MLNLLDSVWHITSTRHCTFKSIWIMSDPLAFSLVDTIIISSKWIFAGHRPTKVNQVKCEGRRPKHGLHNLLDSIRHINWSHDCTFKDYPLCWMLSNEVCTFKSIWNMRSDPSVGHCPGKLSNPSFGWCSSLLTSLCLTMSSKILFARKLDVR